MTKPISGVAKQAYVESFLGKEFPEQNTEDVVVNSPVTKSKLDGLRTQLEELEGEVG